MPHIFWHIWNGQFCSILKYMRKYILKYMTTYWWQIYDNILVRVIYGLHISNVLLSHIRAYMVVKYMGHISCHICATYILTYLKRPILYILKYMRKYILKYITTYWWEIYDNILVRDIYGPHISFHILRNGLLSHIWAYMVVKYMGHISCHICMEITYLDILGTYIYWEIYSHFIY